MLLFLYTHALKRFVLGHFNVHTENYSFPFINTGESISMKEEIDDAITTLIKVSKISSFVITCCSFTRFIFHYFYITIITTFFKIVLYIYTYINCWFIYLSFIFLYHIYYFIYIIL